MKIEPVYAFIGEEKLLRERALEKLKKQCFPQQAEEAFDFNYTTLDGQTTSGSQLISEAQQLPFLTERRMVVVKNAKHILDDTLVAYLDNPNPSTCLVLLIDKTDKRLTVYKSLKKKAALIEFDHLSTKELINWIIDYLKKTGKRISHNDAAAIAGSLENNLTGIKQELDKLATYSGQRTTITGADIQLLVVSNKLHDSFDLTNALQAKDTTRALTLANALLDQGKNLPDIIGLLRWLITRLWQGKDILTKRGRQAVSKELRIPPFFLGRFVEQAEKFSVGELRKNLSRLLDLELTMRTHSLPPRLLLELLIFQLVTHK